MTMEPMMGAAIADRPAAEAVQRDTVNAPRALAIDPLQKANGFHKVR